MTHALQPTLLCEERLRQSRIMNSRTNIATHAPVRGAMWGTSGITTPTILQPTLLCEERSNDKNVREYGQVLQPTLLCEERYPAEAPGRSGYGLQPTLLCEERCNHGSM